MSIELLRHILQAALAIALILFVMNQCRRPFWWLGRRVARVMNIQHSELTDWGLEHLPIETTFTLLDVGCGGGRTVLKLAARAGAGKVVVKIPSASGPVKS